MLKFVFDTNVLVSALISKRGNPALLLDRVRKSYTLFISKDILSELKTHQGLISKFGEEFIKM